LVNITKQSGRRSPTAVVTEGLVLVNAMTYLRSVFITMMSADCTMTIEVAEKLHLKYLLPFQHNGFETTLTHT
jgi:hypothetical protein